MLKSIQGKIEGCQLKRQGEKNGRAWKMYEIIINGEKFTTFDTKYSLNVGKEGTWEYEEKQDGQYINRTLSRYPEIKVPNGEIDENIIRALGVIRGDIKTLKDSIDAQFSFLKDMIDSLAVEEPEPKRPDYNPKDPQYNEMFGKPNNDDIPVIETENLV